MSENPSSFSLRRNSFRAQALANVACATSTSWVPCSVDRLRAIFETDGLHLLAQGPYRMVRGRDKSGEIVSGVGTFHDLTMIEKLRKALGQRQKKPFDLFCRIKLSCPILISLRGAWNIF